MRQVEKQMIAAIVRRERFQSANTVVTAPNAEGIAQVLLHGNHIADVRRAELQANSGYLTGSGVYPNRDTFRQWPTNTTRSRLCALGIRANIKNGAAHIDGKPA